MIGHLAMQKMQAGYRARPEIGPGFEESPAFRRHSTASSSTPLAPVFLRYALEISAHAH